ncbi:MAG: hypothetical protein J6J60_00745 [Clostridia bacterium]|nr:hypothetical protein [Clostridia bacterium]
MGQYYKVINIDKKQYMRPEMGLKLMEWSYSKNLMVLNIMKKLANEWKGDRVFVVGDYAISQDRERNSYDYSVLEQIERELGIYKKKENGYYMSLYHYADENFKEIPLEKLKREQYKYIYNHNKKEYIDLEHCPLAWLYKEKDKYNIVRIAPISLALALGNGMGGGDYWGNNEESVGMYINDIQNLEITKEPLNVEYEELRPEFYEDSYVPYDEISKEIELEERKYKIARNIVKLMSTYDNENYKNNYNSQKDAIDRIAWRLEYDSNVRIKEIKNIILKNEDANIKGNEIIKSINEYVLEKKVRNSLNETQLKLSGGINNEFYINEAYKRIFEKLGIKNIESIVTDANKTTITFETQEKYEIITEKKESTAEFLKNATEINEISKMQKDVIKFFEIYDRIPKKDKIDGLYYYEYRETEGTKVIEKNVWVDYGGTLVTNKDILNGKEYIDREKIFNNPKLLLLDDSDIADKIQQGIKDETKDEDEEHEE